MKLNIKAFSLTFGVIWIMAFDGATGEVTLIGHVYRGFNISPIGSLIGLVWAFADGAVGGAIFAWLYNSIVSVTNR